MDKHQDYDRPLVSVLAFMAAAASFIILVLMLVSAISGVSLYNALDAFGWIFGTHNNKIVFVVVLGVISVSSTLLTFYYMSKEISIRESMPAPKVEKVVIQEVKVDEVRKIESPKNTKPLPTPKLKAF